MLIEAAKLSPWLTVLYANIITARNEFQYLNFEILTPQADNVLWNCNLQSNFSNDFYFQGSLLSTNVYSWFFTKGIQFKSLATPYAFSLVSNVTTNSKFSTSHGKYDHFYLELKTPVLWKTQRAFFTVGYFQNWSFTYTHERQRRQTVDSSIRCVENGYLHSNIIVQFNNSTGAKRGKNMCLRRAVASFLIGFSKLTGIYRKYCDTCHCFLKFFCITKNDIKDAKIKGG